MAPLDPPAVVLPAILAAARHADRVGRLAAWVAAGGRVADLRPGLLDALADPAAFARARAVGLAVEVPGEGDVYRDAVLALFDDPAWVVREAAAEAAGRLDDPDGTIHARLVRVTREDPRPPVREAAAAAAGPRTDPRRDYADAARSPFERQRVRAALALGHAGPAHEADAVALLGTLLTDGHRKVRRAALMGLLVLPTPAVAPLWPLIARRAAEAEPSVAAAARPLLARLSAFAGGSAP